MVPDLRHSSRGVRPSCSSPQGTVRLTMLLLVTHRTTPTSQPVLEHAPTPSMIRIRGFTIQESYSTGGPHPEDGVKGSDQIPRRERPRTPSSLLSHPLSSTYRLRDLVGKGTGEWRSRKVRDQEVEKNPGGGTGLSEKGSPPDP